jgi:hypothetical protein
MEVFIAGQSGKCFNNGFYSSYGMAFLVWGTDM